VSKNSSSRGCDVDRTEENTKKRGREKEREQAEI
jgi:hypothetical protein